jgi:hypothetical protein
MFRADPLIPQSTKVCDSCRTSELAHQASVAVCDVSNHLTLPLAEVESQFTASRSSLGRLSFKSSSLPISLL